MNWLDICALDEINPLGSRVVAGPKGDIAIFRAADDQVFALDDRCPHKGGPLSQGLIYGQASGLSVAQLADRTGERRSRGPGPGLRPSPPGAGGERAGAARPGQRGAVRLISRR